MDRAVAQLSTALPTATAALKAVMCLGSDGGKVDWSRGENAEGCDGRAAGDAASSSAEGNDESSVV